MRNSPFYFTVSTDFYLICAFFVLILPLKWFASLCVAAGIHELFHYLALKFYGINIHGITLGSNGTIIKTEPLTEKVEIISALAGPIGGLLLILSARWTPQVAICGAFQSAFNLLPLYPLDGGRALLSTLRLIYGYETAERVYSFIKWFVLILLFILSLVFCFTKIGVMPAIILAIVIIKYSCKPDRKIVK